MKSNMQTTTSLLKKGVLAMTIFLFVILRVLNQHSALDTRRKA